MLKAFMLPSALSSLLEQTPETCFKILPVWCEEPVGAPAPRLQTPKPDLRAAGVGASRHKTLKMEHPGFDPGTSRMQSERSAN